MKYLFVMLHGYGADGDNLVDLKYDFEGIFKDRQLDVVFFSPNATYAFEFGEGQGGYQWFSLQDRNPRHLAKLADGSLEYLDRIISEKLIEHNIDHSNVIAMGFSQGVMMGLHYFLSRKSAIKCFFGFSGTLIAPDIAMNKCSFPTLLVHGNKDEVVPFSFGKLSAQVLSKIGCIGEFYRCEGLGHSISQEGIGVAKDFLCKILDESRG